MTIYIVKNQINGKQYVGKTTSSLTKRWSAHVVEARNGSERALCRAIRKYGEEHFLISSVDTALTKEELTQKEREWIARLHSCGPNGYNMTPGGDGTGHKHSEATKMKLRAQRIKYFQNQEHRHQAAEYGRRAVLTEEGRQKKRNAMRGNKHAVGMTYNHTQEAKEAIATAHRGKTISTETREKLRESRKGKAIGCDNAMANPEYRARQREGLRRYWQQRKQR